MLLRYLQSDSIRCGTFEVRFSQYSRDISNTQTCLIASINYDIELGGFVIVSLLCCHVFPQGSGEAHGRTPTVSLAMTSLSMLGNMEFCRA